MELVSLMISALLAVLVGLIVHAARGKGAAVAGVPRLLWVFGLMTFDPLIALSYVAFAVVGLAKQASWRRWVVYGAMALFVFARFAPISVPAAGVYPSDSAAPRGVLPPFQVSVATSYGDASSSAGSHTSLGNGWLVRRAVIFGDGHPVSAGLVDRVAELLRAAGVPEVAFVQSPDQLPVASGELIASVSVHDAFELDLGAVAYWSGSVHVRLGPPAPFAVENFISRDANPLVQEGFGGVRGRWRVGATRFGPAAGAARYHFVNQQLNGVEAALEGVLQDVRIGGVVYVPTNVCVGDGRAPAIEPVFAPLRLQPLTAGPAVFSEQRACWRLDLGDDPEEALRGLSARLVADGWSCTEPRGNAEDDDVRWWKLYASKNFAAGVRKLSVRPSLRGLADAEAEGDPKLRSLSLRDDLEAPRAEERTASEYIVDYDAQFGEPLLRDLAVRLLDEGGDDSALRVLGERVPEGRYGEWRARVLAGDMSVANLLCVAGLDRDRGAREEAVAALVEVAAWVARRPRLTFASDDGLRQMVEARAKDFGLPEPSGWAPARASFERAGAPLLGDSWRAVPVLLAEFPAARDRSHGSSARRFVADNGEGRPVLITLEQVEDRGGERWLYVDADGGSQHARKSRSADLLAKGVVAFSFLGLGGVFELRRADGCDEVRWRPRE